MVFMFAISIYKMFSVLAKSGTFHALCSTLLQNPLRMLFMLSVLAYDAQLILFIYSTWTVDFAVQFQLLQFLPALSLVLHSALQQCFLIIVQKSVSYQWRNRKIAYLAVFHLAISLTMLFHLICTFIVASCKLLSESSFLLDLLIAFMPFELVYRLMAIADSVYILSVCSSFEEETTRNNLTELVLANGCSFLKAIELENKKGTTEYRSLSFSDEQHHKPKQLVMGFELYCPLFDCEQHLKVKQCLLVTGFEQCCFKDVATSLSDVSS